MILEVADRADDIGAMSPASTEGTPLSGVRTTMSMMVMESTRRADGLDVERVDAAHRAPQAVILCLLRRSMRWGRSCRRWSNYARYGCRVAIVSPFNLNANQVWRLMPG